MISVSPDDLTASISITGVTSSLFITEIIPKKTTIRIIGIDMTLNGLVTDRHLSDNLIRAELLRNLGKGS